MGLVETRQEKAQREGTTETEAVKGHLAVYEAKQITKGLKEKTVKNRISVLELLRQRGANLLDPLTVFKTLDQAKKLNLKTRELAQDDWSDGTKYQAADAYVQFCQILKIQIPEEVNFRKFKPNQELPHIPLESEVNQLIAGCSRRIATFLQLLRETGARSGEAWSLKWLDVEMQSGIVTFNHPEKHGIARQFKISGNLNAMLNSLPKTSDRIWGP